MQKQNGMKANQANCNLCIYVSGVESGKSVASLKAQFVVSWGKSSFEADSMVDGL